MKVVLLLVLGVAACGARTRLEQDSINEGGGGGASALCPSQCVGDPGFACVTACDLGERVEPSCIAGRWECPPHEGRFPSSLCDQPHVGGDCGGIEQTPCSEGMYCLYTDYGGDGTCGRSGQRGFCVVDPLACLDYFEPVCSCSGDMNTNVHCSHDRPLTDAATYGRCDDGMLELGPRCGQWMSCSNEWQVCVRRPTGVAGAFKYTCEGVPSGEPASCAAAADHECGTNCTVVDGMVMLPCGCSPPP